jgi:uncharacterized LabA/DUF88 family protein
MTSSRTAVYIDAANLILSSRTHGIEYDVIRLLTYCKDKYKATHCVYFTARIRSLEADYELLESLGVEIVYKKLYREDGVNKGNCDVEIANRITHDVCTGYVESVVLMSGDGDFAALVDYACQYVKSVRLFAIHRKRTSFLLWQRKYLRIIYLSDIIERVEKGKGPAGHERPEGKLFSSDSISVSQNKSTSGVVDNKNPLRTVRVNLDDNLHIYQHTQ